jgi:catechol 2,3-dioxygenase-like lactoylglutathione lyase family enzyme
MMSATERRGTRHEATEVSMDMKLEVVVLPVTDVERAKQFYESLGWRLDADVETGDGGRLVQMTPPGSQCSVQFGANLTSAAPGSAESVYLVVEDIEAARDELTSRGVDVSAVFHEGTLGDRFHADGRVDGPAPERSTYGSFVSFSDPDGNSWLVQEITTRLPGREVMDVATVAGLLHETAEHHDRFEKAAAPHDWWDWYAAYLSAREQGHSADDADAAADLYMKEVRGIAI